MAPMHGGIEISGDVRDEGKVQSRRTGSEKIPMCSFCKYQVATKSCLTCILTTPPKSSIKHTMKQSERGTYCDTCFTHEHDLNEHALETQSERRKGIKNKILAVGRMSRVFALLRYVRLYLSANTI